VLTVSVMAGASQHPEGLAALVAVLFAASAMAVQNALLHLQVPGSPSTAVMTGNLVSTVIHALDATSSRSDGGPPARARLASVLSLLGGFLLGCFVAAAALLVDQNWGWVLPTALAGLVAVAPWEQKP
jgi:uncharacterized membrane protein YoaK (UPF0700 family)